MKALFNKTIILTIAIIGVVLILLWFMPNPLGVSDASVINDANKFGVEQSVKIDEYLKEFGECPVELSGWSESSLPNEYDFEARIGNNRESVPVWLKCNSVGSFSIFVRHSIDSDLYIEKKIDSNIIISFGHFTDRREVALPEGVSNERAWEIFSKKELITNKGS